jgi:hypothetical protein
LASRTFDWSIKTANTVACLATGMGPAMHMPDTVKPLATTPSQTQRQGTAFDESGPRSSTPLNDKLVAPDLDSEAEVESEPWWQPLGAKRGGWNRAQPFNQCGPSYNVERNRYPAAINRRRIPGLSDGGATMFLGTGSSNAWVELSAPVGPFAEARPAVYHRAHRQSQMRSHEPIASGFQPGGSKWRLTNDARLNGVAAGQSHNARGMMHFRGGEQRV